MDNSSELFEERAAIKEYLANLPRHESERQAREELQQKQKSLFQTAKARQV